MITITARDIFTSHVIISQYQNSDIQFLKNDKFVHMFIFFYSFKISPINIIRKIKKEPNDGQSTRYNITSQYVQGKFFVENCDDFKKRRKPTTATKSTTTTTPTTSTTTEKNSDKP